jgi:hypothetical protein
VRHRTKEVIEEAVEFPSGRWIDKGCKRVAVVISVSEAPATVSYRYVQSVNGSGLWKRGVVPTQTISFADWQRRFRPEKGDPR